MSEDHDHASLWQPNWFEAMKGGRWYSGPPLAHISPLFQCYYPYACHSCKRGALTHSKLVTCARCHVIRYCGKECQTSDWKFHKDWCQGFHRLCQEGKLDTFAKYNSFEDWQKHMTNLTVLLFREMRVTPHSVELDMAVSQPRCRKCFQAGFHRVDGISHTVNLTPCPKCMGVALCDHCLEGISSEDIEQMSLEQSVAIFHSSTVDHPKDECQNHLVSLCCTAMVVEKGSPLGMTSSTDGKEYWRPRSWQEYFAKKRQDFDIPGPPGMIHRAPVVAFLSDAHSLTLTLQHVLGLPELQGTVTPQTIDRQARDSPLWGIRSRGYHGWQFTIRLHRGRYHEVAMAAANGTMSVPGLGDTPTLVFCQHSGLHTPAYTKDWILTVLALKEMNVPVVWTGFNHMEVVEDGKVLDEWGVNLIVQPTPNPFRGLYPFSDPYREHGDFIFANASFVVSKGSKA